MPNNFAELVYGKAGGFIGFLGFIDLLVSLLFALALLFIIWNLVNAWILNADKPAKVDEGKQYALWGVIGLVVMVGIWGIVRIARITIFGT